MNARRLAMVTGIFALSLAGYAFSAEPKTDTLTGNAFRLGKDRTILVKEFGTTGAQVKGDKSKDAEKAEAKMTRVPASLAQQIVQEFGIREFKALPYSEAAAQPGTLVLDGDLEVISNGSGAARVWIGFAAGQASLSGNIRIYAADKPAEILFQGPIKGTSKGRGGISGGGSMEDITIMNFAKNTADAVTGLDRKGKPADSKPKNPTTRPVHP